MKHTVRTHRSFFSARACSALLSLGAALVLLGCGPTIPQLRATAASDMNCPTSELALERVDSDTMAVIGCGRETIYSKFCDKTAEGKSCGWRAEPTSEN